ncbi:monovalent cation:proton antiporter-2 (CPA2) family protein [Pelagibius sp. Alg239-R121]|uniref:monovalent cation:proton antiporter-2 (CPA2) family protein n=1 Tax=Pelagibius sp. Alg239-R121 TaxID=2993448 RepID=UPI0024A75523|nr:monovalent cation:proton antiporter-2 (CPA2) family protein [Pelagibius sp. Alg239-R121]
MADVGGPIGFLGEAAVFMAAAVVAVPLFKRFGLGSVLGFLAAGMFIGPFGIGIISNSEDILHFAEFGIVLLLFIIGLELKPSRLWVMRREIFGLGLAQVFATGAVLSTSAYLLGLSWQAAIIAGFGLALSSTAFALQILQEKGDLNTRHGRTAFAILLFQDIAVVPLLALVGIFSSGGGEAADPFWLAAIKAIAVVGGLLVLSRFLLNRIFRLVAKANSREVFAAASLLLVVGTSLMMDAAGLSMALGAFLAGVMLADSEFRHQLEADIEPFRGLLLGLFFMAVGMSVDLRLVFENLWLVLLAVVSVMAVKAVLLFVLARVFGVGKFEGLSIASTLCQGGEFAFVLFSAASAGAVFSDLIASLMTASVTISMALTPLATSLVGRYAKRTAAKEPAGEKPPVRKLDDARVIIAGFGRMGQVVAQLMAARGVIATAIDTDPERIEIAKTFGTKVFYGDVQRIDVLRAAGAAEAEIIFVCADDKDSCTEMLKRIKGSFPKVKTIVRAYDRMHVMELSDWTTGLIVRETFESSVLMGREGLLRLGFSETDVDDTLTEFRRRDSERLRLQKTIGIYAAAERMQTPYPPASSEEKS